MLIAERIAESIVALYRAVAPEHVHDTCRFEPTCSEYFRLSVRKYGLVEGLYKTGGRLLRCRPPNEGSDMP